MKTKLTALILMVSLPVLGNCSSNDMNTGMPIMHSTGTMKVKHGVDWGKITGFGKNSNMAAMMTLMMVSGSGMEGMSMNSMASMSSSTSMTGMAMGDTDSNTSHQAYNIQVTLTPNPPAVGDNKLDLLISNSDGTPAKGLKLTATVAMTAMDMGTAHPAVKEGVDGHYYLTANFAMAGMWRVTLTSPPDNSKNKISESYDFDAGSKKVWVQPQSIAIKMLSPKEAKVGKNMIKFTLMDAAGKPIDDAVVSATISMTSMDMGTSHVLAVDNKNGAYSASVTFAMEGTWSVTLNAKLPTGKQFAQTFLFDAK